MSRRYFPLIDLVRFSAAVAVAIHHLGFTAWLGRDNFPAIIVDPPAGQAPILDFGWSLWVGVEIFFVISGAVISASAHGRQPIDFVRNRFLRLYPAVWISCIIIAGITVSLGAVYGKLPIRFASSAVLNPIGPWLDPVFWTLGVELCFYALVAVSLYRRVQIETIACGLALWSGAYLLLKMGGLSLPLERPLLLQHGVFFALGTFLWSWSAGRMKAFHWPFLALAVAGSLLEVAMKSTDSLINFFGSADARNYLVPVIIFAFCAGLIAISMLRLSTPKPIRPIRSMGLMTYPIYLIHTAVGGGTMWVALRLGVSAEGSLAAGLLAALGVGWLISEFAEPALRAAVSGRLDALTARRA